MDYYFYMISYDLCLNKKHGASSMIYEQVHAYSLQNQVLILETIHTKKYI